MFHGLYRDQLSSAGVRLGCYGPVKEAMGVTADNNSLGRKIAAGSLSGAVAAGVTNPLDLIKTRMQSKGNPDKTMMAATRSVLTQGGVKGLWRGSAPSMVSLLVIRTRLPVHQQQSWSRLQTFANMPSHLRCVLQGNN